LASCQTEPQRNVALAGSGRSSDILPGISMTAGFITPFTRDVVKRWLSFDIIVPKALTCLSSINPMEHWR
jgi:hypothetical protein